MGKSCKRFGTNDWYKTGKHKERWPRGPGLGATCAVLITPNGVSVAPGASLYASGSRSGTTRITARSLSAVVDIRLPAHGRRERPEIRPASALRTGQRNTLQGAVKAQKIPLRDDHRWIHPGQDHGGRSRRHRRVDRNGRIHGR